MDSKLYHRSAGARLTHTYSLDTSEVVHIHSGLLTDERFSGQTILALYEGFYNNLVQVRLFKASGIILLRGIALCGCHPLRIKKKLNHESASKNAENKEAPEGWFCIFLSPKQGFF